ncbi:MAG: ABC transporter permease [Ekhidna sp.]|nr:ABC transporter permease [Ekhidna sp.]
MEDQDLPKLPLRFLRWFCKEELIDEIEGDLFEAYQYRAQKGIKGARFKFYREVLQSFNKRNIGIMERYQNTSLGLTWSMVQQYSKVLIRTMQKSKLYSSISIVSLTLGMACAGLIYLYLKKELSFDTVYDNADQIYRINHFSNNSNRSFAFAPTGMVPYLVENLDGIEHATRLFKYRRAIPITVTSTNQPFNEADFGWVDPTFFEVFNLPIISGAFESFKRPYTVMISESAARRYLADKNPIGKAITYNGEYEATLEVVGVFQDFPSNTSFKLDLISNFETCHQTMWASGWVKDWNNMFVSAFVHIKPGREEDVLKAAQAAIDENYVSSRAHQWETSIQKLTDIHLQEPQDIGEYSSQNDMQTITLFAAIGIIIMCLGCFNFVNMVTAQASQRAKEVGVRKVLGSRRKQISQQTLFETIAFVLISGVLAWLIMSILLPYLECLTIHSYDIEDILSLSFISGFCATILLIAFLAGAYPALYLSKINSLFLMRKNHTAVGGSKVRNVLVTLQFTITSGLVICTLIVFLQMRYIQNRDLGFDESTIISMPIQNDQAVIPKINAYRNELSSFSGIGNLTAASHEMLSDYTYISNFSIQGFDDLRKWERYTVEQNYINTFELELVAGRGFDSSIPSDSSAFVLNESAIEALNLTPQEALNLNITDRNLNVTGKVIGVVKDFHYRSLHHDIQPFVMYVNWDRLDYISVQLSTNDLVRNIELLEEKWIDVFGESVPFFYQFLDQTALDLYQSEKNESMLFSSFSSLSILLGALGLFGAALFNTERRYKEIGLRKVLGANAMQLIMMINQNFIKMLFVAFIVAAPLAFLLMDDWLSDFAYRIDQPVWVYVITIFVIFTLASFTVSYLSWKAASANPVEAIKTE